MESDFYVQLSHQLVLELLETLFHYLHLKEKRNCKYLNTRWNQTKQSRE